MSTANTLESADMISLQKQPSIKMLVIYMITALLFLVSVELHIHTQETASTVDHGLAVSISTLASDFMSQGHHDEITVSPESALKVKKSDVNTLAIFLLIAVMLTILCRTFIGRLREGHTLLPIIPFHGTPPLRAPPH